MPKNRRDGRNQCHRRQERHRQAHPEQDRDALDPGVIGQQKERDAATRRPSRHRNTPRD